MFKIPPPLIGIEKPGQIHSIINTGDYAVVNVDIVLFFIAMTTERAYFVFQYAVCNDIFSNDHQILLVNFNSISNSVFILPRVTCFKLQLPGENVFAICAPVLDI